MKYVINLTIVFLFSTFLSINLLAQKDTISTVQNKNKLKTQNKVKKNHGLKFVDANGDGYNDNAPDHDGDGIPNGLDEDYHGAGKQKFIDLDGDGINDNKIGKGKKNRFRQNSSHGKKRVGIQNKNSNSMQGKQTKTSKGKNGKGGH